MKLSFKILFATLILCFTVHADDRRLKFGGGTSAPMTLDTNLFVCAGCTTSNSAVMGTIWTGYAAIANPTSDGNLSNLYTHTFSSSLLCNDGDTVEFMAYGVTPTAQANTNELAIVYGATTILDTGLQTASNTTFRLSATLTRTGAIGLNVIARCEWGPGNGAPWVYTNSIASILESNTVDTVFAYRAAARRAGSLTNLYATLRWIPAGR